MKIVVNNNIFKKGDIISSGHEQFKIIKNVSFPLYKKIWNWLAPKWAAFPYPLNVKYKIKLYNEK